MRTSFFSKACSQGRQPVSFYVFHVSNFPPLACDTQAGVANIRENLPVRP